MGDNVTYTITQEGEDDRSTIEDLVIESSDTTLTIQNQSGFQNLTGKQVQYSVTISNESGENQVAKVFLHFSDSDGEVKPQEGEHVYMNEDGSTYTVFVKKTDDLNTWCLTCPLEPGRTVSFTIVASYPSLTTDGGELLVWGGIGGEADDNYSDTSGYHLVTWDALESTTVTTVENTASCEIKGKGTATDHAKLRSLGFNINTTATPASGELGRNPLQRIDYTVTVTLPEGMQWNSALVEAHNSKTYPGASNPRQTQFNVTLDGVEYELLTLTGGNYNTITVSKPVFSGNQLSFTATQSRQRADLEKDLTGSYLTMSFGPELIETTSFRPNAGQEFAFDCQVSPVYHYRYSSSQGEEVSYTHKVTAIQGNMLPEMIYPTAVTRGESFAVAMYLRNKGSTDYPGIQQTGYELSSAYAITPENMEDMFKDTYGKYMSITVKDMTVHETSHLQNAGENVTLANTGYISGSPVYDGKAHVDSADCLLAEGVNLTVQHNDDGVLVVHVDAYTDKKGNSVEAQDYPVTGTIREVFDSIGLLPNRNTTYTVTWNATNQSVLYSGEVRTYRLYVTHKDEYTLASEDKETTASYSWSSSVRGFISYKEGDITRTMGINRSVNSSNRSIKSSYRMGDLNVTDTLQQTGSVAMLHIDDGAKSADPIGHPLIALIRGGQVLLVDAEENPQLAALEGIRTLIYEGKTWYLLDKPGTYNNVYIGSDVAQSVIVSDYAYVQGHDPELKAGEDGYLEYQINWHTETTATYDAMLLLLPTGVCDTAMYRSSALVYANNHQGHRLYCSSGLWHTFISAETDIVTQRGETPEQDQLTDYQHVQKGGQITYRVKLTGELHELASQLDVAASFTGSTFYDILPSLAHRWTSEDIQMRWVYDQEKVSVTNEDAWTVENGANNQDTIRWSDDFVMEFRGETEVYLYITVEFPEGENWDTTVKNCGDQRLENCFIFYKPNVDGSDTVYHDLVEQAQALLVVGVNKTGIGDFYHELDSFSNTAENSRRVYSHRDYENRLVQYYVTVYNDGNTRLYMDDIQIDLPDGFKGASNSYNYGCSGDVTITYDDVNRGVSYTAPYSQFQYESGNKTILLRVEGYGPNSGCSYDELLDAYYLTPGQAITFRFYATTGERVDNDGSATCVAAMPYRDFAGCGIVEGGSTITGMDYLNTAHNDGECDLVTNADVAELGFIPSEDPSISQWLFSSVTMTEQGIGQEQPDLTVEVSDIDFRNAVGDGNYAQDSATITWAVIAHNYSGSAMYNYTIVDTIQRDYDFTGEVYATFTYGSQYIGFENYSRRVKLFNISSLTPGKTQTISTTGIGLMHVTYIPWSAEGEEMATLSIQFLDAKGAIPDGGSCTLELSTKNTGVNKNQTYTNNAYIIPEGAVWNEDTVEKGNVVMLDGVKAVQASSQVTVASHFATAASKAVTQTGNPENTATSKANAERIYIRTGEDKVDYTLSVSCFDVASGSGAGGFQKLVLIDNLPEPGDHNTFDAAQPRYSDFKISLAPDAQIVVSVKDKDGNVTPLDADDYILQFSTETSFTEDDWTGASSAKWTEDPTNARSFRIVLDREATGCCLDAGKTLLVNFEAVVDDENASAGDTAWNSFGYYYTVNDSLSSTTREMKAEPMKVGVSFVSTPEIQVDLVKPNGDAYEADADVTFSYVILEGELPETQTAAEDALANLLAGRTYTYADMTVAEGATQASRSLLNPKVYNYAEGVWQATDTPWEWKDGVTYTAIPQATI